MLSKDDRKKIKEEVQLILEVQNGLHRPKGTTSKIISFLNTGLGLWLLSTIVVGFGSAIWSTSESRNDQRLIKYAINEKLKIELSRQLSSLRNDLYRVRRKEFDRLAFIQSMEAIIKIEKPIFPENKERSVSSLIWQLKDGSEDNEKPFLTASFNSSLALEGYSRKYISNLTRDSVKYFIEDIELNHLPKFNKWLDKTTIEENY